MLTSIWICTVNTMQCLHINIIQSQGTFFVLNVATLLWLNIVKILLFHKENKNVKENTNVLFDLYNNIHKYKNRNKGISNLGIFLPEILWRMVLFIVAYKSRIGVYYESFCLHLKLPLVNDLAMNAVLCCLPSVCSVSICDIVDII